MVDRHELAIQGAKIELARREFFFYCHLKAPGFYREDRKYLVDLCTDFQEFMESDDEVMVLNLPPRHGKSRTAGLFVEWVLGNDQTAKVMTGSYNETLSTMFSKNVRNDIMEEKADENRIIFSDIFPGVRIKRGDGAMNLWSLESGYNNYLATSPTGTATGFGASLLIIDDLIKNAEEANNELTKEKHWTWFTDTMLSRLEEGGKIIIIMTRWASDDLAGRALEHFKESGAKVRHISMKALQDDGAMLCPEVLSRKSYEAKIKAMGADIASANYQQEPIDLKGRLYTSFKTYSGELPQFKEIRNYTDTADTGEDYLCSINYGVTFANEAYILDVLYTKDPMEVTEPATTRMLLEGQVNVADIESNNGGRSFARSIERVLKEILGSNRTVIRWFAQTKNKQARIYSNSAWVMQHVYYPEDWKNRWPEYHNAMIKYQREGKNKHDDAPDATTGVAEKIGAGDAFSFD
ncbi:phage terminase large subunit [Enterocloster citroniae]|uniref:phage terminase large subunit n=1 Tax=Enterocloster citroniae TaxID=358743 RepID=UPI0032BF43A7